MPDRRGPQHALADLLRPRSALRATSRSRIEGARAVLVTGSTSRRYAPQDQTSAQIAARFAAIVREKAASGPPAALQARHKPKPI